MWNYKSETKKSSGYEDVMDELSKYTSIAYKNATKQEQDDMIEKVFNIYRTKNIFPISYYNTAGVCDEIIRCMKADGKELDFNSSIGQSVCKFLFENLHKVECKGVKNNSIYDKFYDDHKLKRAIKLSLDIKEGVKPSELFGALELIGGNSATNFKPMSAKSIYEYFLPNGGAIYDYSCGFGGRMLGALTTKSPCTYYGCEPCTETFQHLNELGQHIEMVSKRKDSYHIFMQGSEIPFTDNKEFIDFAFSSPPYFNLEKYSDEDTQCYIQYPTLESWYEGYVKPTIQNIYNYLKPEKYYAVNIADFNVGKTRVKFVDKWLEISESIGFKFVKTIDMNITVRSNTGNQTGSKDKKEGIYVFKKTNNSIVVNETNPLKRALLKKQGVLI